MPLKEGYPQEGELVVCKLTEVTQFAAWGDLLEYKLRGMIPISEAVGKWIFDVREVLKEGQVVVAKVMKVEKENGLVHLSLKRVSRVDEKEKMNEFRREQRGEKLLEIASSLLGKKVEDGYKEVGFLLVKKFGSLFEAFNKMDREKLEKLGLSEEWIKVLLETKEKSIKEKESLIIYEIEVKSLEPNSLDLIKSVLKSLEEKTGGKVKYLSAPIYRLEIATKNPKKDEKKVEKILEKVSEVGVQFSYRRVE
ncbi:MAG: S1 RNA-binding domain-containing protein [Candidatus Aenigmarchaeota archaeon]|nr:S1 RNA-binding domain-containing protein [Candidatus Aenigmarchaeota archaeon]MDW8160350.1 S1 RNA-binding domain-containing protein [Candidatus Aenigmarchaeota archaeon]